MQAQALSLWRAASPLSLRILRPSLPSAVIGKPQAFDRICNSRVRCELSESKSFQPVESLDYSLLSEKHGLGATTLCCLGASAALLSNTGTASAAAVDPVPYQTVNPAIGEVSAVLEAGVLLLYLGGLLSLLAFGTFLVVRQVLVRRELENAAKELQERVRSGQASSEEYFELGAVMLRKKFYTLANKYLLQAIQKWEGDEQELAQVHNALGFSYFSEDKWDKAVAEYEKAVKLQPAYVTAWNNMGDALEKKKNWAKALKAYESSLTYDPSNRIASERREDMKRKVSQFTF